MEWWQRVRADLRRPEVPTDRDEAPFLAGSAVVILTIAFFTDPGSTWELLGLLPALVAFILRGYVARLPAEVFAALVMVPVVLVVGNDGNLEGAFFLTVIVTLDTASQLGSTTRAVAILIAAAATPWLAEGMVSGSGIGWTAWTTASVFTFTMGRALRRQKILIAELKEAREALAAEAVAEERRRIARELHDLAGHTLAAVLLHVTGARHVLRRDIDEAERALIDAETVGRASLDQIRATVASLRADERGTDPALAGSADLGSLIDEYRRAGLEITATIAAEVAQIDGPVGTALHRILRESLANVARHAPTNEVHVGVTVTVGAVHLVVVDHGHSGRPPDGHVDHFGVVGMRERARALGGQLEAGPTTDGWRVEAQLPIARSPCPDGLLQS